MALTGSADNVRVFLSRIQAAIERKSDPADQAAMAHVVLEAWMAAQPELARMRAEYLRIALANGYNQADMARLMGVSPQRISQLLKPEPTRGSRPKDKPQHTQEDTT